MERSSRPSKPLAQKAALDTARFVRRNVRAAPTLQPVVPFAKDDLRTDRGDALSTPRKRKLQDVSVGDQAINTQPLSGKPTNSQTGPSSKPRKRNSSENSPQEEAEEKRTRLFRKHAPKTFLEKLSRAQTQRMIVVSRSRGGTATTPTEDMEIVGSTGNVYRVSIGRRPSCTCPDSLKGNECKHKVYALHTVLKAPPPLQYQLVFLSAELRDIFAAAPPIPSAGAASRDCSGGNDSANDGKRKPYDDDGAECPICYTALLAPSRSPLVWCRAACGTNMHSACFAQWAATRRRAGQPVTCVYCRSLWEDEGGAAADLKAVVAAAAVGDEGYVNVAAQLGWAATRDHSSYHQPWVRRAGWTTR